MATLVLSSVGGAVGNALAPGFGEVLGRAAGALAGAAIDEALFAPSDRRSEPPALKDLQVQSSTEGAPIPRLYGTARLAGQVIWASPYQAHTTTEGGSGKGSSNGGAPSRSQTSYRISFAVGLCEGPIKGISRIWADGEPLERSDITLRIYKGGEEQMPDALLEAMEGEGAVPSYRGLSYAVFENLDVTPYGNRIPQLSFEIVRSQIAAFEKLRAVTMIPTSTEFGLKPQPQWREADYGKEVSENVHNAEAIPDWTLSLNQLQDQCENCQSVALVVSWFGNDLRAGECRIRPAVEIRNKKERPETWKAAGLTRANAHLVSLHNERPAFGGTPSDASVIAAIQDLKRRGFKVLFYPLILMDIPNGNRLPNPYGGTSQEAYPIRGRITASLAPGQPRTPDGTSSMNAQIQSFFGRARATQFRAQEGAITYSGTEEWGLRRMILHYAHLCKEAGGVEAFLIASELQNLTTLRGASNSYPAVQQLRSLAAEVKTVLPASKLSYAAGWGEYGGHLLPNDGGFFFHLDPLWADSKIDFVGINYYMPLADWREGETHLDARAGHESIYDQDYLRGNLNGGEYYDWYYASQANRESQTRTPIQDSRSEPWIYRAKDMANWWKNRHHDRVRRVRRSSSTAWRAGMKPIWLTELGCPAIDKGANAPYASGDEKASASTLPPFSNGARDDQMQASYLEAVISAYDTGSDQSAEALRVNPVSASTSARMISPENIYVWTWDARPYPYFPQLASVWGDTARWKRGHWINGRTSSMSLAQTIAEVFRDSALEEFSTAKLNIIFKGFVVDRVMSARDILDPLMRVFSFEAVEREGRVVCAPRSDRIHKTLTPQDCVLPRQDSENLYHLARAQETELPQSAKLLYLDFSADYRQSVAEARRLITSSRYTALARIPIIIDQDTALDAVRRWLEETWAARERAQFLLPPSQMALEPGDNIRLNLPSRSLTLRIIQTTDAGAIAVESVGCETSLYRAHDLQSDLGDARAQERDAPPVFGKPVIHLLDLPLLEDNQDPHRPLIAAASSPWPGRVQLYRSASKDHGFRAVGSAETPALIGLTSTALKRGPESRWQRESFHVRLIEGEIESASLIEVLNGAHAAALQNAEGAWEVIQFETSELIAPQTYKLSNLLRGQAGSEGAMMDVFPVGTPFVLLSNIPARAELSPSQRGKKLYYRGGPAHLPFNASSYHAFPFTFQSLALRPLSPVHIRAKRSQRSLDVSISWQRRTRVGGDDWGQSEAPLGEESESYIVEILKSGSVVRSALLSHKFFRYLGVAQYADFDRTYPDSIHIRIAQMSRVFGRGQEREVILHV